MRLKYVENQLLKPLISLKSDHIEIEIAIDGSIHEMVILLKSDHIEIEILYLFYFNIIMKQLKSDHIEIEIFCGPQRLCRFGCAKIRSY